MLYLDKDVPKRVTTVVRGAYFAAGLARVLSLVMPCTVPRLLQISDVGVCVCGCVRVAAAAVWQSGSWKENVRALGELERCVSDLRHARSVGVCLVLIPGGPFFCVCACMSSTQGIAKPNGSPLHVHCLCN